MGIYKIHYDVISVTRNGQPEPWHTTDIVDGIRIGVVEGWARGPYVDSRDRWEPGQLGDVVADLVARARPLEPMMPSDL